jgi:hypothetical protein
MWLAPFAVESGKHPELAYFLHNELGTDLEQMKIGMVLSSWAGV